ncbi:MAG: phosphoribosyl-ATP diphosphatase [Gemmatimonadota bacterium]
MITHQFDISRLDFARGGGFVTVVTCDHLSGTVLMVARADREAVAHSLTTGEMHYHSRTRGLWHKGETSGNVQRIVSLAPDCDGDVLLATVVQRGPACHTGQATCFGPLGSGAIGRLAAVIEERLSSTTTRDSASYTRHLGDNRNLRLKKIAEEAGELIVACADDDRSGVVNEAADLIYHTLVAVTAARASLHDVLEVLEQRSLSATSGERGAQNRSIDALGSRSSAPM